MLTVSCLPLIILPSLAIGLFVPSPSSSSAYLPLPTIKAISTPLAPVTPPGPLGDAQWTLSLFSAYVSGSSNPSEDYLSFRFNEVYDKDVTEFDCVLAYPIFREKFATCGNKGVTLDFKVGEDEMVITRTVGPPGGRIRATARQGPNWQMGVNKTAIGGPGNTGTLYWRMSSWPFPITSAVG